MEVTESLQKCMPRGGICRQRCLWRRGERCCWGGVNLSRGVDRDEFRIENCKPETERWPFREHLACPWPGSHEAAWGDWVDLLLLPVKESHMDDYGYSLPGSSTRTLHAVLGLHHPQDELQKVPWVAPPLDSRWLTCRTGMMPWVLGKDKSRNCLHLSIHGSHDHQSQLCFLATLDEIWGPYHGAYQVPCNLTPGHPLPLPCLLCPHSCFIPQLSHVSYAGSVLFLTVPGVFSQDWCSVCFGLCLCLRPFPPLLTHTPGMLI